MAVDQFFSADGPDNEAGDDDQMEDVDAPSTPYQPPPTQQASSSRQTQQPSSSSKGKKTQKGNSSSAGRQVFRLVFHSLIA